jgi:hypothetical protein
MHCDQNVMADEYQYLGQERQSCNVTLLQDILHELIFLSLIQHA